MLSRTPVNYWSKLRRKNGKAGMRHEERAFTAAEMVKLFRTAAKVRRELLDTMTLGALMGGRIEELAAVKQLKLSRLSSAESEARATKCGSFTSYLSANAESPMGRATGNGDHQSVHPTPQGRWGPREAGRQAALACQFSQLPEMARHKADRV
jgi:hypothetical protein